MNGAAEVIADAVREWLTREIDRTPYGELNVNVRLHAGRPPIVERTTTIRDRYDDLTTGPAGGRHGSRDR